jgi:hypothetical protein
MSFPLSPDTSTAAAAAQFAVWRAMSHAEKLGQVRSLTAAVLRLELQGLARRHPSLSSHELHRAAVTRRLGPELAARVHSPVQREP